MKCVRTSSSGAHSRGLGHASAGALVAALAVGACAGRTRGPEAPVIVAGSVCSGVRGLGPQSLGDASSETPRPRAGLIAALTEPSQKGGPAELLVMELGSQRLLWQKRVQASARPQILQDLVVTASGDQFLAFDLTTGTERFRSPLGRPLWMGAAQSGSTVLLTTGAASWDPKQRGSSLIALDAQSGGERWHREVPYALSAPVIRAQRAVVVSDHADLWTLDLETGADTGCGPLGGNTVEWLEAAPSGLLFGAAEARQLGADAHEAEASLELARRDLPGRPFIRSSSYLPVPAARSAHGRVAAIAPLHTSDHGPAHAGGFYFVFYRDVFGFRADGSLAWAQLVDADVARARASDSGLWLVTEAGILLQLDAATGEPRTPQSLGVRIASADIRTATSAGAPLPLSAAAQTPAAPTSTLAQSPPVAAAPPPPAAAPTAQQQPAPEALARLQASLRRVADDTDARLLPARALAVDELARLESPTATGDLLAIYAAPNTPSGLRDRIAKRLRERTSGSEHLVAALAQHQDFLEERSAPPLRAIVPGLITQHDTRAVPGLVDQLFDPNTPVSDLGLVVSAIDVLSGDQGREPLRRFFSMYRSDSALASDPSALVLTAQALIARNDAPSRALLEATRDSVVTAPALREQLAGLLAPPPAAAPEPAAEVAAAPVAAPPPPIEIRTLLDAARPQLAPCVDAARARTPKLTTVRVWFVALPDGSVRDVRVTPIDERLASCLGAKLAELRLPSDRKQLVSYQLAVPPTAAGETAGAGGDTGEAFWALAARRAPKSSRAPQSAPWWVDKNPLFVVMDEATGTATQAEAGHNMPAAMVSGAARASTQTPAKPSGGRASSASPQPAPQPGAASSLTPAPATPSASEDNWWVPAQDGKH
jgi:outer membrane protein assembly factor BamB